MDKASPSRRFTAPLKKYCRPRCWESVLTSSEIFSVKYPIYKTSNVLAYKSLSAIPSVTVYGLNVPLLHLPRRRLCRNAKSHECHSEPQAKNLTIAAPCKCEILRLPPQDDIATQSLAGERRGGNREGEVQAH